MAGAPCDWLDTRLAKSYLKRCNYLTSMATLNDLPLKYGIIQDQIAGINRNLLNRVRVCSLQNHTGPAHTGPPTAGNLGNERCSPVDLIGTGRIRATGNLQDQRDPSVDIIGTGRTRAAGIRETIENRSDTFA